MNLDAAPTCSSRRGSYEEYHPYGSTAWWAESSGLVSQKRYRFTGMERDEETGLQCHGVRYYAVWLGRWVSADPIGLGDGVNRYEYVSGHPISFADENGLLKDRGALAARQTTLDILVRAGLAEAAESYPTLTPFSIEMGARKGELTRFNKHPGSSFLGMIAEDLVSKELVDSRDQGWLRYVGLPSQSVTLQPSTRIFGDEVAGVIGTELPDLFVAQAGWHGRAYLFGGLFTMDTSQGVRWKNTIGPGTNRRVGTVDFGVGMKGKSVFSLWEVTASTQYKHIADRAARVAGWAKGLSKLDSSNPDRQSTFVAALGIDRGVWFTKLTDAQRTSLASTVTSAGGYIMLFDGLTSSSIQKAKDVQTEIRGSLMQANP